MAKQVEKVALQKDNTFRSNFNLIGEAKITDFTYKINEISQSGYKYSRLNLGIETQVGNVVYCEAMGGFFPNKENKIQVSSKDDIKEKFEIDWVDRFDDKILDAINDASFIKIGIEKYDDKGTQKTYTKRFLNWYDAIAYVKEHLTNGMVLNVKGNLKYSKYQDKTQIRKEIRSIFLSTQAKENYRATFVQTILVNKDSADKLDEDNNEYPIYARVIDYTKMYNNKEVKQNIPYNLTYYVRNSNPEIAKKLIDYCFKVKKGITEIAVEGDIVEGTQVGEVTEDDIPDDMKELIELGIYKKEEIIGKLTVRGDRISKMIITKPYIQQVEEDDKVVLKKFIIPEKYSETDLYFDFMDEDEDENTNDTSNQDSSEGEELSDSDNWLKNL